jgi:hypothetical protein
MAWSDPLGALDLALQMEETAYLLGVADAAMEEAVRRGVIAPESFAAALVALPESVRRAQAIEGMIETWTVSDAEQAPEWLLAQGQTDSPALFRVVAANLGDPDLAAIYADRIPATARTEWIQTTADIFSSRDPTGAAEWIEQFRDEPAYSASVSIIANAMARYDGPGAVELLNRSSLHSDPSAVAQVASHWASRDMDAAIEWVQTLTNVGVRRTALGAVARRWESTRPDEAEQWVLTLPSDEDRDAILYAMISIAFIREAEPSESLLHAYSDDYSRQVAAANAAREMKKYNEPAAIRLLDRYVSDQELLRLFESGDELPFPN